MGVVVVDITVAVVVQADLGLITAPAKMVLVGEEA
jgi:hypothetical protein